MTPNTARQPQGIPAGGQFAPETRAEPTVILASEKATHTAPLNGTIELHNQWFDQLPEWPEDMPAPEVSFGFDDGKAETYVTVDGHMMTFWESDMDGTIDDTDTGTNPWEDFDDEDQEKARAWGKAVHERIDSATYGVMIEGSHSPAVREIILAQAVGKEPAGMSTAAAAPDLTDASTRNAYLAGAEKRFFELREEVQNIYMIGAAQELREEFPAIDSFHLSMGDRSLEISEAWDADGNPVDDETIHAASQSVFRYRDENDFNTFTDQRIVSVADAISFRPGS